MSLKSLLAQNKQKKEFVKNGGDIVDFPLLPPKKELPPEPSIKSVKGKPDQCFVICPDVHSYVRDKGGFNLFMKSLPILNKAYNVTKFVQLGDLVECGELNGHPLTTVYDVVPSYIEEMDWAVTDFWEPVKKALPNAQNYAIIGNHEDRLNSYLAKRMGATDLSVSVFNSHSPNQIYEDCGIHVTPYGRADVTEGLLELFPGLVAVHGWSVAKNASATHLTSVNGYSSIIHGHTHRAQSDIRRNAITNEYMRAYSFGSLAKVSMNWHKGRPMDHTLGFGLVFTYGDSYFIKHVEILMGGPKDPTKRTCLLPNGDILETHVN